MSRSRSARQDALYTPQFFLLLAALFAYMSGHNLLAHFSQFVTRLGGDLSTIGWIAGTGMLGSLALRPWMGPLLDRVGARRILIGSTLTASASFFAFQFVSDMVLVGALRVMVQLALASFLMAVAVFSAQIAPPGRTAESLATVGIGGLAGLMVGPTIGDFIFAGDPLMSWPYTLYHNLAAGLLLTSCVLCMGLSSPRDARPPASQPRERFFQLVMRYWPGTLLVIAFCLAAVQTIPMTFVERMADARGFANIKWYFLAYSPTAIILRIVARRLPGRVGRRRTLIFGMTCYAAGVLLLAGVHTQHELVLPAVIMGVGHCFSYPFLLDLAGDTMPPRHRGTAVALVLAMMDIGFLLGNIAWGYAIEWFGFSVALSTVSAVTLTGVIVFAVTYRPVGPKAWTEAA